MPDTLTELFACPRCDKSPLETKDDEHWCSACQVGFPSIGGLPWLFAEPQASLAEWRNRLHMAQQKIGHEIEGLELELKNKEMRPLSKRRVERYLKALGEHQRKLKKLVAPMTDAPLKGNFQSYLALRTRLPIDQGLHTYYPNIFRDWCVLLLRPDLIWSEGAHFCPRNAASGRGAYIQPGIEGFEAMFAETVHGRHVFNRTGSHRPGRPPTNRPRS